MNLPDFIRAQLAAGNAHGWQSFGTATAFDSREQGQDIGMPMGTPIPGSAGVVIEVAPWCGSDAIVRERLPDGTILSVAHVSPAVAPGAQVDDGTILGYSAGAPSSCSSGPHIEFQVQPGGGANVDPVAWLQGGSPVGQAVSTAKSLAPVALAGLGLLLLFDAIS